MTSPLLPAAAGLVFLILGADLLVRGAARLAAAAGISPLVIGLTVVGFATSSPELAVSMQSVLTHEADIAVGNAVGSNIFNVLVILGVSALITPLAVSRQLIRLDVPVMIAVSIVFYALALNGTVSRGEGLLLFSLLIGYLAFQVWEARRQTGENEAQVEPRRLRRKAEIVTDLALVVVGLVMLVVGSGWLVDGAVVLARTLGVSELIIGLTVVAAGTGMPEAATSVVATLRGERDIAVGNVVGSNIFNLLCVLGLTSVVSGGGLAVSQTALNFDIPIMVIVSVACLPVFYRGFEIARWEGAIFFLYYILYVLYLMLAASRHDALPVFSTAMLAFVIPLTIITFAVIVLRSRRRRRAPDAPQTTDPGRS